MKILTAIDGTLIVLAHVATVNYGLDHEGYNSASFAHFRFEKEIERAKGDLKLQTALMDEMAKKYPDGKPQMKDYYRTKVGLSDGRTYWVNASRDHVVELLLAS